LPSPTGSSNKKICCNASVAFWHKPADSECPLSRRVLEDKRTCHGDRENDVHDPFAEMIRLDDEVPKHIVFRPPGCYAPRLNQELLT
jgi:hypothetical protein